MMRKLVVIAAVLAGCGSKSKAKAPPSETPEVRAAAEAAAARLAAIEDGIRVEDVVRGEVAKTQLVGDALALPLRRAQTSSGAALIEAVAALEQRYLATPLDATDAALQPGPWSADDGRDQLGSATVDARLRVWAAHPKGFLKFVVVAGAEGTPVMRVGSADTRHVDIGGGPALTAGLLRVDVSGATVRVTVLENTSGGYRPGPLRNALAVAALQAAGRAAPGMVVHDNPTGDYPTSELAHAQKMMMAPPDAGGTPAP
ncbi:MAG: hypothetical protein IT370_05210 [Deltaproteobacteria bacterium]|nr:hypothetical protein [Deltaproteobacteria bacterium]